nr:type I-F CRISPR-associated protein Csy3 [Thiorhodovibrio winogradskyi]
MQLTDTAKLSADALGMVVRFSVRFLDLRDALHAVSAAKGDQDTSLPERYRASFAAFVERAIGSAGVDEVATRFARNIANGRWLWRNRTLARALSITTTLEFNGNGHTLSFDALSIPTRHFDGYAERERSLAGAIADGLNGRAKTSILVEALVDFGIPGAVEVFPSQSYVPGKPSGFARPLYCVGHPQRAPSGVSEVDGVRVMGQAALRDQKLTNALRTIDTWYPGYDPLVNRPIAIEPNGASLREQRFFRVKHSSAFELSRQLNVLDPNTPDGMYMLGVLVRGGVLSSAKE